MDDRPVSRAEFNELRAEVELIKDALVWAREGLDPWERRERLLKAVSTLMMAFAALVTPIIVVLLSKGGS